MDKCSLCDSDFVWVGDIFSGELKCQCGPQPTPEEVDANIKELNKGLMDYDACCVQDAKAKSIQPWGKSSGPANPELKVDSHREWLREMSCAPTERRSGKTYKMVLEALEAAQHQPVIILVHNRPMIDYVERMMRDITGLERVNSVRVLCPEYHTPRGVSRDCKVFMDHSIFDQWSTSQIVSRLNYWTERFGL